MVFHLPLRQTEGFLRSVAQMREVELPIPDHTTLSRRLKKLGDIGFRRLATDQPIYLVIDSTGLEDSRRTPAKAAKEKGLAEIAPGGRCGDWRDRRLRFDRSPNP